MVFIRLRACLEVIWSTKKNKNIGEKSFKYYLTNLTHIIRRLKHDCHFSHEAIALLQSHPLFQAGFCL